MKYVSRLGLLTKYQPPFMHCDRAYLRHLHPKKRHIAVIESLKLLTVNITRNHLLWCSSPPIQAFRILKTTCRLDFYTRHEPINSLTCWAFAAVNCFCARRDTPDGRYMPTDVPRSHDLQEI